MSTSSSVPALEVTRIRLVPRSIFNTPPGHAFPMPYRAPCVRAPRDAIRYTENSRPGFQDLRRLTACISPFNGAIDDEACLLQRRDYRRKPLDRYAGAVERIGTICRLRGVGTTMWNGLAPIRNRAKLGQVDRLSRATAFLRMAAVSPDLTAQRSKISQNGDPFRFELRSASMHYLHLQQSRPCLPSCPASRPNRHKQQKRRGFRDKPGHDGKNTIPRDRHQTSETSQQIRTLTLQQAR